MEFKTANRFRRVTFHFLNSNIKRPISKSCALRRTLYNITLQWSPLYFQSYTQTSRWYVTIYSFVMARE